MFSPLRKNAICIPKETGADYSNREKWAMRCNILSLLPPSNFPIFPLLIICPVFFTCLVFIIVLKK